MPVSLRGTATWKTDVATGICEYLIRLNHVYIV